MGLKGSQFINCSVESCKYNKESSYCTLKEIMVAPHNNIQSGNAGDESLCASYQPR